MNSDIQQLIQEAIKYRDPQRAREVLLMASKDSSVKLSKSESIQLNYLRMNSLDIDRLMAVMKDSLLEAYRIPDFNLEEKIADYFELLNYTPLQIDFIYKLKALIEQHQEFLGNQKISVNGKSVAPTIANWLLDYTSLINSESQDALGELKYINTGVNLKVLTIPQRKALQSILRIYDKISELVELWELIPDQLPPEEMEKFRNWATKKYEEELGVEEQPEPEATLPPQPAPVAAPVPVATRPVQPVRPVQQVQPVQAPAPASAPVNSPYKITPQKDLDLSTEPKKGLIFDTPTNIDLKQEAVTRQKRAEEKLKELKIRTKLDDLKNRTKSKN